MSWCSCHTAWCRIPRLTGGFYRTTSFSNTLAFFPLVRSFSPQGATRVFAQLLTNSFLGFLFHSTSRLLSFPILCFHEAIHYWPKTALGRNTEENFCSSFPFFHSIPLYSHMGKMPAILFLDSGRHLRTPRARAKILAKFYSKLKRCRPNSIDSSLYLNVLHSFQWHCFYGLWS